MGGSVHSYVNVYQRVLYFRKKVIPLLSIYISPRSPGCQTSHKRKDRHQKSRDPQRRRRKAERGQQPTTNNKILPTYRSIIGSTKSIEVKHVKIRHKLLSTQRLQLLESLGISNQTRRTVTSPPFQLGDFSHNTTMGAFQVQPTKHLSIVPC